MSDSTEKTEVVGATVEGIKDATKSRLDGVKEKIDPKNATAELIAKFWEDFTNLSSKERMKRIGEILFVATIGRFIGIKALTAESEPKANENVNEGIGKRIADVARRFIGMVNPEFRTPDVQGGNLGCAKVATTILKEAGLTDSVLLGVDETVDKLQHEGWKEVSKPPHPGDVIVWAPVKGYKKDPNGVDVANGHKHIGIALDAKKAVSNSSEKKMPLEHDIYTKRPVEKILRAVA